MLSRAQPPVATVLRMDGIAKAYGATVAVRRVSLDIRPGEIHAVLGENGAGKSTIVKVLSGTVVPDRGVLELDGRDYAPRSPMDAREAGVSTAFQELSLLPNLTVAQNFLLPRQLKAPLGLVSSRRSREQVADALARHGLSHIHPDVPVRSLSLGDKQRIEIARAVSRRPKLLVLDEPTAALADPGWLFDLLAELTASGTGVLYISHRLSEVRRLCRRGTVLRNGESIETVSLEGVSDARIFEMMVGVAVEAGTRSHAARRFDAPGLTVKGLASGNVRNIDLDVQRGEIVGIAALEGQGQRDLMRALGGLAPLTRGEVAVEGRAVPLGSPMASARAGIGFVPEERKTEGIFLGLRTDGNITLSRLDAFARFGIVSRRAERAAAEREAQRVDLAPRYLDLRIGQLSGGNQQKALIGRVLLSGARVLVLFDPTRGVDVGTKAVIYDLVRDFVAGGGAVLIYSTELSELVHLVDRCVVLYRGRIVGEAAGEALSEARLVALAAGQEQAA